MEGAGPLNKLEVDMNRQILFLVTVLGGISASAQPAPQGVISHSPAATNELGNASVTFTNRSGATYSADQLAAQLQNLRTVVDRSLPLLTAYTETVSNAATTGNRTVVGTISEILAGALNRNAQNQPSSQSNTQGGFARTLQGLLGTNATTRATANPIALHDLGALQSELQSVESILQRLNVGSSTNLDQALTPTGR